LPELSNLAILSSFRALDTYLVSNPVPLLTGPLEPADTGTVPILLAAADVLRPNVLLNFVEMVEFLFGLPSYYTLSLI
jgi:hypothetical protein